jgi:hypothetical protein
MKRIIHVNQHKIRANIQKAPEDREPVLALRTYKERTYGNTLTIMDKDGEPVARIVYSPDKPLDCGARVWIETYHEVEVTS